MNWTSLTLLRGGTWRWHSYHHTKWTGDSKRAQQKGVIILMMTYLRTGSNCHLIVRELILRILSTQLQWWRLCIKVMKRCLQEWTLCLHGISGIPTIHWWGVTCHQAACLLNPWGQCVPPSCRRHPLSGALLWAWQAVHKTRSNVWKAVGGFRMLSEPWMALCEAPEDQVGQGQVVMVVGQSAVLTPGQQMGQSTTI